MVVVCNGLPNPIAAEQRMSEITDTVYSALGDDVAAIRRRVPAGTAGALLST